MALVVKPGEPTMGFFSFTPNVKAQPRPIDPRAKHVEPKKKRR